MSKRKREDQVEQEITRIKDQALRIKVARLKVRFDNGVQQLTAQLKLARGFDRQKMTRRLKQAESDPTKLQRLQEEIEVLKFLKEASVARKYLLKQCLRTKRIQEAEAFTTLFGGAKVKGPQSVAEGNVLGRLFKSSSVSDVLPEIMKGIREVLGVDKEKSAGDDERTTKPLSVANSLGIEVTAVELDVPKDEVEAIFEGFSDLDREPSAVNTNSLQQLELEDDSEHNSDDDVSGNYSDRLAASSDEDEDERSDNDSLQGQNHDRNVLDDMEITTDEDASEPGDEADLSPSEVETGDQYEDRAPRTKPNPKPQPPASASTAFLPSLMMGGYYSGDSESEGDNANGYDPDKVFGAATKKERKNRRGQQERRAIAEKKFGAKANHVVRQNGAQGVHGERQRLISGGRSGGWDAKRGAVGDRGLRGRGGSRGGRGDRRGGMGSERGGSRFGGRNDAISTGSNGILGKSGSARKNMAGTSGKNEKMHPSWEAARKRKMEMSKTGAGSFAGKKITFD